MAPTPDFSGYVTKYGIKCSDGRTILAHAFAANDGAQIPLVWQHQHDNPENVLGHLILHSIKDGVRADGFFNDTSYGQQAKALVKHKDIKNLSIYANQLVQRGTEVLRGNIREGSLVMAGANPGAFIDTINIQHGDGSLQALDDEAVIFTDEEIVHAVDGISTLVPPPKPVPVGNKGPMPKPSASDPDPDKDGDNDLFDPADGGLDVNTASIGDIFNTLTPEQKNMVYALVGAASSNMSQSDDDANNSNNHQEGDPAVSRNVFDQTGSKGAKVAPGSTLSHSDIDSIFKSAQKGGSLKEAVEEYCLQHGIDDISTLFPYDQAVSDTPEFISRRMEWVAGVLGSVRRTPFSRIRSWTADITFQEARARGYIKANLKREEFVRVAKRITTPQTIYKKQKLDRDDILDITEFDVVQWLQTEMRILLDEELARAILIGDGRDVDDPDKIDTLNVRPIYGDDDMYTTEVQVESSVINANAQGPDAIVDAVVNAMRFYRGSGNPVMYTTRIWLAKMLLAKDTLGRRLYPTVVELSAALGVSTVIACEALEASPELIGIVVNLVDYTVGADKGGEVSMFDFFDIDYNQFKYLMETRVSGAMTKYRGALAIVGFSGVGGLLPDPTPPTFDDVTGIVTIPTVTHVSYVTVADDGTESAALTPGAQAALAAGAYVTIKAVPASTYEFSTDSFDWTFRRDN